MPPVVATLIAMAATGCASKPKTDSRPPAEQVSSLITGTFSSAAQSMADPRYQDVTLRATPIWTDRTDAQWIYMEQALSSDPDQPIRQRVYRVAPGSDGGVEVMVLGLPDDPRSFAGAWRARKPLNELTPEMLSPMPGCVLTLRQLGASTFRGATVGDACRSTRDGAAYSTSQVLLEVDQVHVWDRGFDTGGRQVWGATAGPYRFIRLSRSPAASVPKKAPATRAAPSVSSAASVPPACEERS